MGANERQDTPRAIEIVPNALYTPEMLAEVVHSSITTVYRALRDGTLPATPWGRSYRTLGADLIESFRVRSKMRLDETPESEPDPPLE